MEVSPLSQMTSSGNGYISRWRKSVSCCFITAPHSTTFTILPTLARNMKFLAFGGGGQVAQHFAKTAIAQGHEVIAVVRDDSQ